MAERNSEVDKSTGKTNLAFAEIHANIESVFAECEKMIDLLFTEDERTVTHSAISFNISAFNPMSVQTGLVCSQQQYLVDELVPKDIFGHLMKGLTIYSINTKKGQMNSMPRMTQGLNI
jgi:hypothetical protein